MARGLRDRLRTWLRTRRPIAGRARYWVACEDERLVVRDLLLGRPVGPEQVVSLSELQALTVVTTDRGPFEDDLFFVLELPDGEMIVASEAVGGADLAGWLARLPGLDKERYLEALTGMENRRTVCWRREGE